MKHTDVFNVHLVCLLPIGLANCVVAAQPTNIWLFSLRRTSMDLFLRGFGWTMCSIGPAGPTIASLVQQSSLLHKLIGAEMQQKDLMKRAFFILPKCRDSTTVLLYLLHTTVLLLLSRFLKLYITELWASYCRKFLLICQKHSLGCKFKVIQSLTVKANHILNDL